MLQEAQEKVYDKKSLYDKILESYRASKKKGITSSLARKLKKRKLRKLRRKSHKSELSPNLLNLNFAVLRIPL